MKIFLTRPVLCISESCFEIKKLTYIFIFTIPCGASKGSMKVLKVNVSALYEKRNDRKIGKPQLRK